MLTRPEYGDNDNSDTVKFNM